MGSKRTKRNAFVRTKESVCSQTKENVAGAITWSNELIVYLSL